MPILYQLKAEVVTGAAMSEDGVSDRSHPEMSATGTAPSNAMRLRLLHDEEQLWDMYLDSPVTASLSKLFGTDQAAVYVGYGFQVHAFDMLTGIRLWGLTTVYPIWSLMSIDRGQRFQM
jgi:hypothetical protein